MHTIGNMRITCCASLAFAPLSRNRGSFYIPGICTEEDAKPVQGHLVRAKPEPKRQQISTLDQNS